MTVQTVTSGKVQTHWAEVADIAKSGDPVTITQYGRSTLVLMRYQDAIEALRELAKRRAITWMDRQATSPPPGTHNLSLEELNTMIDEERSK